VFDQVLDEDRSGTISKSEFMKELKLLQRAPRYVWFK
jgi:hypothetical protein